MASVYIETTIPSYLTSAPSRDLVVAGHQQITHTWWQTAKDRFELFVSEAVLREVRAGDPECATRRLDVLADIPILPLSQEIRSLAEWYQKELHLPQKAGADALHIATAVSYDMDYLVTWNCAHIANGHVLRTLMKLNHGLGRYTPLLLTPQELMSEEDATGDIL
jgi:predicted nucleic acid-binding protein